MSFSLETVFIDFNCESKYDGRAIYVKRFSTKSTKGLYLTISYQMYFPSFLRSCMKVGPKVL